MNYWPPFLCELSPLLCSPFCLVFIYQFFVKLAEGKVSTVSVLTRLRAGRPGIFILGGGRDIYHSLLHSDRLWSPHIERNQHIVSSGNATADFYAGGFCFQ
jgi:hypothetical protein